MKFINTTLIHSATTFLAIVLFTILSSVPSFADDALLQEAKASRFRGDVIFLRGGFDVFSRGLDSMAASLRKRGVKTRVVHNAKSYSVYKSILKHQRRYGRKPVILVGHSWGANEAIDIARSLKSHGIKVNYLVTFAATAPKPIPRNVRKATNYYFKKNGWGKSVRRGKGMRGRLRNIDLSKTKGVHHFNIEDYPRLQRQVLRNILRIMKRRRRA